MSAGDGMTEREARDAAARAAARTVGTPPHTATVIPTFTQGWAAGVEYGRERTVAEIVEGSAAAMLDEFHTHPNANGDTNGEALRATLHREEHRELQDELDEPPYDRAQIARELADVVYVAYGTAWVFGIDLDVALREIHRCAMVKLNANCRREDGKIIKPPGFMPPDMTAAIEARFSAATDEKEEE